MGTTYRHSAALALAARYGHDGQRWHDDDGVPLEQALEEAGAVPTHDTLTDRTRWALPDRSAIITTPLVWDVGYRACWCLHSLGHLDPACPKTRA